MRKNGKNKKLALLVGMAMAFSAAYSVAPSDALAATYTVGATTSDGSTTWTVTADGEKVENATADTVKTALKTAGNTFTLDSVALTALKGGDSSNTEIAEGNTITVETKSGDNVTSSVSYTAAAGSESNKTGIDSSGKLAGSYSTITVNGATGDSATATEVSLADKATVGTYEVAGGKVKLSGTATTINVAKDAVLSSDDSGVTAATINLAEGATLADSSSFTAENVTVAGAGVDLSKATLKADTGKTLSITNNSGSVTLGDVAAGTTVKANGVTASKVAAGANIDAGAGDVTLTSVAFDKASDSAKQTSITGNDITITSAVGDGVGEINAAGKLTLSGGFTTNDSTSIESLKIKADTLDLDKSDFDTSKVKGVSANNLTTASKVTVAADSTLPFTRVTAKDFTNSATTEGAVNLKSLTLSGTYENATKGAVTVDSLKLEKGATFSSSGADIDTKTLIVSKDLTSLDNLKINGGDGTGDDVKIIITGADDSTDTDTKKKITDAVAKAIYGNSVTDEQKAKVAANTTTTSSTGSAEELSKAEEAVTNAKKDMQTYSTYTADEIQTKIANADPFTTKLPSAADLQAMTSSDEQKNLEALNKAQKALYESQAAAGTLSADELAEKIAALPKTTAEQAEKIRAAVQNAGKTAAAPAVTSARTAAVVADVVTTNVVNRTAELRSFVPSAESEEKPDNLWFQYKHSKTDVDSGDVYSKSTVKTNSYQLGYDAKVSDTDIVGGYVGTTTGSAEFNGPSRSGSVDIKNALDLGLYGTHMMSKGQYLDYMLHRNKFDNRTMGQTYGTTDLGAMLRYGVKIAQPNGLTLDPYIQLAYDKISVDSYQAGENTISSDDSNNFSTKIGLNLITTGGLYGGLAYSRGLSGSYSAYVNGIAMPSQDNDTNVIYLNLGYRANIARDIFLDLSLEKTFCDYDGWNAAGKVNFYF